MPLGYKHTAESRAKISAANKGRIFSKEWREKLRIAHRGVPLSEEHRKSLSKAFRGVPKSEHHRIATRLSKMGEKNPMYIDGKCKIWNIKRREKHLRITYGLSAQQYEAIYNSQGGKCSICGRDIISVLRENTLSVKYKACTDHDHVTGMVRGLLCHPCNLIIGSAGDRVELLLKAIEYLKKYGAKK